MSATVQAELPKGARLRPAAPIPHNRALSPLQVIREMGRNPIAAFGIHAYNEPFIYSRNWVQDFMMVSDPDGIKYVLLDNVANYHKSIQFQRLTRPALGNGLVELELLDLLDLVHLPRSLQSPQSFQLPQSLQFLQSLQSLQHHPQLLP